MIGTHEARVNKFVRIYDNSFRADSEFRVFLFAQVRADRPDPVSGFSVKRLTAGGLLFLYYRYLRT